MIQCAKKLLSQVTHPEAFLVDGILRNLLEKWYRVSTGFSPFPEGPKLRSVEDQKSKGLFADDALAIRYFEQKK